MSARFFSLLLLSLLVASCNSSGGDQEKSTDHPIAKIDNGVAKKTATQSASNGNIRVESPRAGETLPLSRFTIQGSARTFEGNVLYRLVYDSILTLTNGFTTAAATEAGTFGPFSATVEYSSDWGGGAVLEVYEQDAASGEEINILRIPVILPTPPHGTAKKVYVYFPNNGLDKGSTMDCAAVYPVQRELPERSVALARGALYYLLKGPSESERESGYESEMPEGLRLESLSLDSGLVRLEFSRHLNRIEKQCYAENVRAQIEQTLTQFPTINAIAIGVEGKPWALGR